MIKPLLCLLLAAAAGASHSQSVWRCGADGRSYSDQPCADGQVLALADPQRASPAVLTPVDIAMIREQRLAQQLAEQRRERERETRLSRDPGVVAKGPAPRLKPKAAEPPARHHLKLKRQASPSARDTSRAAGRASRVARD